MLRAEEGEVEAWTDFRLPFQISEARVEIQQYKERLRAALKFLAPSGDEDTVLDVQFQAPVQPVHYDIENVLFYNVGGPNLTRAMSRGIRFEARRSTGSAAPDGRSYAHYTRYTRRPATDSFAYWQAGEPRIVLPETPLHRLSDLKAWQVWTWIQQQLDRYPVATPPSRIEAEHICVSAVIRAPVGRRVSVAHAIKPLLDGIVTILHAPVELDSELIDRASIQTGWDAGTIAKSFARDSLPLFRSTAPLKKFGPGLLWSPDDHCCVAVEFRIEPADQKQGASLQVALSQAVPR